MAVNQLKAGAVLSYLNLGITNVAGLLFVPFMLRMMGQQEYGLYSLVASIVSYLTVLDFGFGNAIVRYTSKYRAEGKTDKLHEMFGMFSIIYCGIGFVALLFGIGLYFNIDHLFGATMNAEELYKMRIMIILLVGNIVFTFAMSIWRSIPVAYERFIFVKAIATVRAVLNPLVMILLLYMGYKAIAMVVVITVFNVFALCVDVWYCYVRLHVRIKFARFKWDFFREVAIYSVWIFLGAIVERIYWGSGQFILGMYAGSVAVAIYAIAVQLSYFYMGIGSAVWSVFLPKVTTMVTKENNEKAISDLFIRSCRTQYILMSFILVGFIVFGKPFILLWAGKEYEESYFIAVLLLASLLFPYVQNLGAVILQARNQVRFYALLRICIALACLVFSVMLARIYGGIGCAIAVSMALSIGQVIMNIYYYVKIHIDIPSFWRQILKMSVTPFLLCIGGWYIVQRIELDGIVKLAIVISLFSLVYIVSCWLTVMNGYERNLLKKPILLFMYRLKPKV